MAAKANSGEVRCGLTVLAGDGSGCLRKLNDAEETLHLICTGGLRALLL